jgi:hypothetical protein
VPPRPTKKARGRMTPGLIRARPEGSGVTSVEDRPRAGRPDDQPEPLWAAIRSQNWPYDSPSYPRLHQSNATLCPFLLRRFSGRLLVRWTSPAEGSRKREFFSELAEAMVLRTGKPDHAHMPWSLGLPKELSSLASLGQ